MIEKLGIHPDSDEGASAWRRRNVRSRDDVILRVMAQDAGDFPAPLAELAAISFLPDGIEYEPFDRFLSGEETTEWLRAWTGNAAVDGDAFRVFGQDCSGGHAAFWLVRDGEPLVRQPIVFLGSEGEIGVVASNLSDFLWLLAEGSGPMEVVEGEEPPGRPPAGVEAIAERHAGAPRRTAAEVVAAARNEFADFGATIEALVR